MGGSELDRIVSMSSTNQIVESVHPNAETSRSRSFSNAFIYDAAASRVETLSALWDIFASYVLEENVTLTSKMQRKSSTYLLIVRTRFFSASLCCSFFC